MEQKPEDASQMDFFNSFDWHDAKLFGLSFYTVEGGENRVKLSVKMLGDSELTDLVFWECVYVECDVNLMIKSMCSDDISWADCSGSSEWKTFVSAPNPADPVQGFRKFERHLHFTIEMCPPSGRINVLARGFSLEKPTSLSP